jgi:hypothetical protein
MNRTLNVVSTSLATLFLLGVASGCKVSACPDSQAIDGGKQTTKENCIQFEPTEQFTGNTRTVTNAWSSGKSVTVTNGNGEVNVLSDGSATEVKVDGIPFTRDTHDQADNAYGRLAARPDPAISADAAGNVTVNAPYHGFDGYRLTVHLPAAFDGVLVATTGAGDVVHQGTVASSGNSLQTGAGDVKSTVGAASNIKVTGRTGLGVVAFTGAWTSPVVATDQESGSAQLGAGAGSLDATTDVGDITFAVQ